MTESIRLDVNLRGFVRRTGRVWIAVCPAINVASQGRDQPDAQRCLQEAVELWFDSCVERGTLDQALRECGFSPANWGAPCGESSDIVKVSRVPVQTEILGNAFDVRVSVPAYQAARFLDSGSASPA